MTDDFDPVLSEIVRNYELTMNREMGRALVNLSGSFLFVSASDYACGCLDAEGNILTTIAWSLQMGFAMSNTVRASLERFGDDLHPGDMIFANDPYDGGGLHSHDVVVVAPVFSGEELVMWVGVSAHVTDVGGAVAGGYAIEPMECYGENLRFTPVKFYDQGRFRGDIIDAFLTNTRVPKQTGIDIKALLGAVWIGRERLDALLEQHGAARIRAIHASQISASGRAFRERLRSLPDGAYSGAAHMEHDGASDRVYTIRATVMKRGDSLTIDYTGTDPQSPGALNCTDVGGVGNVIAAIGTVLAPDIPFNQGLLAPVDIVSPSGTLVNAVKPAPISGATVYGAWFGTDAILEALNYMIAGSAECGGRRTGPWGSWTYAWLQGSNQYGEPWFWNVFTGGAGGASAFPGRDGENAMMGIQTVDAFTPNIEDYERQSPVLFVHSGVASDSGGAGRWRGGLAGESFCVPYECEGWDVTVFQNRLTAPSSAVGGGYPGAGAAIRFARGARSVVESSWSSHSPAPIDALRDGAEQPPARARGFRVEPSDGYYIRATGGPGLGDPLERDPLAVLGDVERGWVSVEMAASAYGVAVVPADTDSIEAGDAAAPASPPGASAVPGESSPPGASAGAAYAVDASATVSLRDAERARRRGFSAVLPAGPGDADLPAVAGAGLVLSEALEVDAAGRYRCRACNHDLASNRSNWKYFVLASEAPVSADSIRNRILERADASLVFRTYCCPGCATQLDTEVALAGEPPRWNYRGLD